MIRRPLLWILTGWILGELLAAWLGLVEVPASSYYASEETDVSLAFLEQGKAFLKESLRRLSADDEEEGIFTALLLGDRRSLPEDTYSLFQNGGIAHIIAISGLHLSLIAGAVSRLLLRLGLSKKTAALISGLLLFFYVLMIGGAVSAWRAFIMYAVQVGALLTKRTYDAPSALGLAGLLILLKDPLYLFNAAFQLSFGAVWALSVAAPVLVKWLRAEKNAPAKALIGSDAVQLVTFPLVAWHFYILPLYGLFLNLLVVPLTGAALASVFAAALAALVYVPGGVFLCGLAHYVFLGIRWLCVQTLRLPGALWVTGQPHAWQMAAYFGLLTGMLVFMKWKMRREERLEAEGKRRREEGLEAAEKSGQEGGLEAAEKSRQEKGRAAARTTLRGAAVLALCLLILLLQRPARAGLAVTALYVGQGDCILLELPGGGAVMIDGGSSTIDNVGKKVILPYLQKHRLTRLYAVFLSHPDEDHINGIGALLQDRTLLADRICASQVSRNSEAYGALQAAAGAAGTEWNWLGRGDRLQVGELTLSVQFEGLESADDNDQSMALLMEYGGCSALFMGDAEEAEELAGAPWPRADLLKAGHHGSRFSSGEAFLAQVRPKTVLISAGKNNLYGHPHPEALERFAALEANVYCTAELGNVTIELKEEQETMPRTARKD